MMLSHYLIPDILLSRPQPILRGGRWICDSCCPGELERKQVMDIQNQDHRRRHTRICDEPFQGCLPGLFDVLICQFASEMFRSSTYAFPGYASCMPIQALWRRTPRYSVAFPLRRPSGQSIWSGAKAVCGHRGGTKRQRRVQDEGIGIICSRYEGDQTGHKHCEGWHAASDGMGQVAGTGWRKR